MLCLPLLQLTLLRKAREHLDSNHLKGQFEQWLLQRHEFQVSFQENILQSIVHRHENLLNHSDPNCSDGLSKQQNHESQELKNRIHQPLLQQ